MLFNSLDFLAFFAVAYAGYLLLGHRGQNWWLLFASYLFYATWDWRFLGLIALSTVVDYGVALGLARTDEPRRRKSLLALSIVTNLGILGTFKYAGFFLESLTELLSRLGLASDRLSLEFVLPVGISFYTFQTLSYAIDVYRRRAKVVRNLRDFALFVSFFPQLVAGPIERARRLLPQIQRPRRVTLDAIGSGGSLALWGFFKKVFIADNLARIVDAVYAPGAEPVALEAWFASAAFLIQIYCDFSGYSDIARGIARTMGFELTVNFRLPFWSRSPSEFWSRWHISLTSWFRDYVYAVLRGGRRGSSGRRAAAALITLTLVGVWHGAGWHFAAWGFVMGFQVVVHQVMTRRLSDLRVAARWPRGWHFASGLLTFNLIAFSLPLFRGESLGHAFSLWGTIFGPWHAGLVPQWITPAALLLAPLILMEIAQWYGRDLEIVQRFPLGVQVTIFVLLGFGILLLGEDHGDPFIYFQF